MEAGAPPGGATVLTGDKSGWVGVGKEPGVAPGARGTDPAGGAEAMADSAAGGPPVSSIWSGCTTDFGSSAASDEGTGDGGGGGGAKLDGSGAKGAALWAGRTRPVTLNGSKSMGCSCLSVDSSA